MALYYDKHLEIKNKWQNQQITKHFKNNGCRYRWQRYTKSMANTSKIDKFDMNDHELSIKYNPIPIWDCSYCTYTNIERKSHCNICNAPYSSDIPIMSNQDAVSNVTSSDITKSNHMTLGQFCKNVWDSLSIPVWICCKCTYRNVEQLSKCQMCLNPYDTKQIMEVVESGSNAENIYEIYEEFTDEIDENYNEYQENPSNNDTDIIPIISEQNKDDDNINNDKAKISVTVKLTANKFFQKEKSERLQLRNEDILRHTLLEAELEIFTMNKELIKSYSYIPAQKHMDDTYTAIIDTVMVPIKYKYRNRFGEFGYFCNNNPLKCVAEFVWKAQFPYLDIIECPKWEFIYPEDKNVRSPSKKEYIIDAILPFLPLKDIINSILFKYLGYDEIEIVKITTIFDHDIGYFQRYKIKDFEKELFMSRNNGKLPFILFSNSYTTIKSRKIDYFLKLTEIGYNYSGEAPINKYWLNEPKRKANIWHSATWNKYVNILRERYANKNVRNRHNRKQKRRYKTRYKKPKKPVNIYIKQFYPKKYLYFKKHGVGAKPGWRRRRRNRRSATETARYGRSYWYWREEQRKSDPRYANALVKWYLQKDKRYIDRKWSAYWKLNEREI